MLCRSQESVCLSNDHKASRPDEVVGAIKFLCVGLSACLDHKAAQEADVVG